MKNIKTILITAFFIPTSFVLGQHQQANYSTLAKKADSLYKARDYVKSAFTYSEAFKANEWKASSNDRYNAACSWSLANYPDSAFFNLNRIATLMNYTNYGHITSDKDLNSLHQDARWNPLLITIRQNKDKAEANLNKPLVAQLDSIFNEDQKYRKQISAVEKQFGNDSKEMKALSKTIYEKDSVNLKQVIAILETYGWPGVDIVGSRGNSTLFLVIQHSDQATQEKYLPMMREAVSKGKAQSSSLALLEDRVALGQGKRQVYGSQVGRDPETQLYYILPLEDPDNVDKRRAAVGLQPLADYVSRWQIKWDVEQYKKDLQSGETKKN